MHHWCIASAIQNMKASSELQWVMRRLSPASFWKLSTELQWIINPPESRQLMTHFALFIIFITSIPIIIIIIVLKDFILYFNNNIRFGIAHTLCWWYWVLGDIVLCIWYWVRASMQTHRWTWYNSWATVGLVAGQDSIPAPLYQSGICTYTLSFGLGGVPTSIVFNLPKKTECPTKTGWAKAYFNGTNFLEDKMAPASPPTPTPEVGCLVAPPIIDRCRFWF